MFMILRKKTILVVILIAALCIAGALSAKYSEIESVSEEVNDLQYEPVGRSEMVSSEAAETDKYILAVENKRSNREDAIELLNDIVNNVSASPDVRQDATEKINSVAESIMKESAIEELLKAKGYEKSVIYINDKEITASIFTENLSETDVAKIRDIILSQTDNNNIKIVAVQ